MAAIDNNEPTKLRIRSRDDKLVEFDRALLLKASKTIQEILKNSRDGKDPEEVPIDAPEDHLLKIREYIVHHEKEDKPLPPPPLPSNATLDTIFEDKWDAEFFRRVQHDEKDQYLVAFSRTVDDYINIEMLARKVHVVIAAAILAFTGNNTDIDKISAAVNEIIAKNKALKTGKKTQPEDMIKKMTKINMSDN